MRMLGLLALAVVIAVTLAFLFVPLLALFISMPPAVLLAKLTSGFALQALALSLQTTCLALVIILLVGTPFAYWLARRSFLGIGVLETLLRLPIVAPPAVAGVGLLIVFGRFGLLGGTLTALGLQIGFTSVAVVMAQVFMSAPFYIQAAKQAFAAVDENWLSVSRTLGHGPVRTFWYVMIPLTLPGLVSGATLAWARALGEFGATMMFAGNLPGVTQTLPLAIYTAMQSDVRVAVAISALLIFVAFVLLIMVKGFERLPFNRNLRRPQRRSLK